MINTNVIIRIFYSDLKESFYENDPESYQWDDTSEAILEALDEAGYKELDTVNEEDMAVLFPIDKHAETPKTIREGVDAVLQKHSLPVPDEMEIIILSSDNVSEWAEYLVPDVGEDIIEAIVTNSSDYLTDPDGIERVAKEEFIGRFDDEDDFAAYLAADDPKIQELDEDIRDALDLARYYRDTIRFDTWHEDDLWFWNR